MQIQALAQTHSESPSLHNEDFSISSCRRIHVSYNALLHDIILVSSVVHDTWYCIRSGFTQGCLTCSNWPQTIFAEQLLPSELKTWQNNILSCGEAFDTYFFNCCQFLSQCLEKVNSSMLFSRFVCLYLVFLIFFRYNWNMHRFYNTLLHLLGAWLFTIS